MVCLQRASSFRVLNGSRGPAVNVIVTVPFFIGHAGKYTDSRKNVQTDSVVSTRTNSERAHTLIYVAAHITSFESDKNAAGGSQS
jgi:hypothetical protein